MTSFLQQTASYLAAEILASQSTFISSRDYFFYGSTLAFFTLGIFSDLLSQGRNHYTLLAILISTEIVYFLTEIIYCAITMEDYFITNNLVSMTLFGYVLSIATVV